MTGLLYGALAFAFALLLLITVHELGHFLAAKLFGMRASRFMVGFPPRIWGRTFGETEYAVGTVPLGGFVTIDGMVDETAALSGEAPSGEAPSGEAPSGKEVENARPKPWEYRAKPRWQRAIVITAGVVMNALLAVVILAGLQWKSGEAILPMSKVDGVYVENGSFYHRAGLRSGDRPVRLGGAPLVYYRDLLDPEPFESLAASADGQFPVEGSLPSEDILRPEGTSPLDRTLQLEPTLHLEVERKNEDGTPRLVHLPIPAALAREYRPTRRGLSESLSPVPSIVGAVAPSGLASTLGIRAGDRITRIGDARVSYWPEVIRALSAVGADAPVSVAWVRPSEASPATGLIDALLIDTLTASIDASIDPSTGRGEPLRLGIRALTGEALGAKMRPIGLSDAVTRGFREAYRMTIMTLQAFGQVLTGYAGTRSVIGPIMIAKVTADAAQDSIDTFWRLVAALSITLAIANILPIPALDGGHLAILLVESILRRDLPARVLMSLQRAGMVLVGGVMILVIISDLVRLLP